MKQRTTNILLGICAGILLVYLLVVMVIAPSLRDETKCTEVKISISDICDRKYVKTADLMNCLCSKMGNLQGCRVDSVSLYNVEQTMLSHPMIRTANAYFTPQGRLAISVTQRQPVLRVMTDGETYFIDSDRKRMPVETSTATYVPVITGRVSQRMASQELFDFVRYIGDDRFWNAQIEQINVVSPKYIELVPRVGSGVIVLGDLNDCPRKLRKLQKLYQDGFSSFGWKNYREIDIRYRGQVVCRK